VLPGEEVKTRSGSSSARMAARGIVLDAVKGKTWGGGSNTQEGEEREGPARHHEQPQEEAASPHPPLD